LFEVFYLKSCKSVSIFESLLSENISIYTTMTSNAVERSWKTYCPKESPSLPLDYWICLGDLYNIYWMVWAPKIRPRPPPSFLFIRWVGNDIHNLRTETLRQQYKLIRTRTSVHNTYNKGSHVIQYGELGINEENVFMYIGANPNNDNSTFIEDNSLSFTPSVVNQRDADLIYYLHKVGIWYGYRFFYTTKINHLLFFVIVL
ncbi:vacuolar-processing enzyme-like, partial [Dendrobium catenatum]|uniref:vacuolar-processing enzyme-like n=1 Tax=Dendrobium catenatum TaxID=906689 RepID=UPI0010A06648